MARELGLAAGAKGDIWGSTVHGDLTISGHQPRSLVVDVKNFNPISQDVGKEKAAKERKNEGHYKMVCAAAGMDFASFVTTVWGGFGKPAELALKMLASRLVQEDVFRIQVSFMKQIALNSLATMKRIHAVIMWDNIHTTSSSEGISLILSHQSTLSIRKSSLSVRGKGTKHVWSEARNLR